jgi:hypothetical protein
MHGIVRASVPLMEEAHACAERRSSRDPIAAGMLEYLRRHIEEEANHDEWILEDLEILGVGRSDALGRIPSADVAALVGAQYYWIHHHHPLALLGYIAVLEGTPIEASGVVTVARDNDVPLAALRTLLRHAELDPEHKGDLDLLLDGLPLGPTDAQLLGISALHTVRCLRTFPDPWAAWAESKAESPVR